MKQYITTQGDAWDSIAYKLFADEAFALEIIQANPNYMDYMVLPAKLSLQIPQITKSTKKAELPIWIN